MNQTTVLHQKAMDYMDRAETSRRHGVREEANEELLSALDFETQAAETLRGSEDAEPSRSILYRSAASIAMRCGQYIESEKLIHRALAGNPPVSIAEDLRNLLEDVTFQRHLSIKGVELSNIDVQVAIEGNGIGYGIAPTAEVIPRIEGTNILLYRTAERIAKKPYREAGRPTNEIRDRAQAQRRGLMSHPADDSVPVSEEV